MSDGSADQQRDFRGHQLRDLCPPRILRQDAGEKLNRDLAPSREGAFITENEIGTLIVESAIEVHRNLGPGLLESVYEGALALELTSRGLVVQRQVSIAVEYKVTRFDEGFRADLVINQLVIVELKSVEVLSKAHRKQIQTYLRLAGMKLGYLLNFGAALLNDGLVRAVNGLEDDPLRGSASQREMD